MVFGTIFGPFLRVHFHVSGRKYTPDLGSREGSKMAILGVPDPLEEGPETLFLLVLRGWAPSTRVFPGSRHPFQGRAP